MLKVLLDHILNTDMDTSANEKWLQANKDHYLYMTWETLRRFHRVFAKTSCEVTANRLAEELSGKPLGEWKAMDIVDPLLPFYVIDFQDSHMAVVHNGHVYESYYGKFYPRKTPFFDHHIQGINELDDDLFAFGTKSKMKECCEIFQYTP